MNAAPPDPAALAGCDGESRWLVACLCAAWCRACEGYRAVFAQGAEALADKAQLVWVDIEDHADRLGDLDIENFPTLLIAHGDDVRFFGTVMPHADALIRLVERAAAGGLQPVTAIEPADLPRRVRALASG